MLHFLTNKDVLSPTDTPGLNGTELTLYVEHVNLIPRMDFSNPANVDGTQLYDGTTTITKNVWHRAEAFIKLNTKTGTWNADGIFKYWLDGNLEINSTNVMMLDGVNADHDGALINQFILAPWLGDGSPAAQGMQVDQIWVGTE